MKIDLNHDVSKRIRNKLKQEGRTNPIIVIEGSDGAGKTTTGDLLAQALQYIHLATPYGEYAQPALRDVVHAGGAAQDLLFYLSSNLHISQSIKQAKQADQGVVCVRYITTTVAYHALRNDRKVSVEEVIPEELYQLIEPELEYPDLYLYLYVSPEDLLSRLEARGHVDGGSKSDQLTVSLVTGLTNGVESKLDQVYRQALNVKRLIGDAVVVFVDASSHGHEPLESIVAILSKIIEMLDLQNAPTESELRALTLSYLNLAHQESMSYESSKTSQHGE